MPLRVWVAVLLVVMAGCEQPHSSIQSILARQSAALRKLPEEDRSRLMETEDPATPAEDATVLEPGVLAISTARGIALRDNPSIHAVRARLETALARVAEARSFYLPKVELIHRSTRTFLTPDRISSLPPSLVPSPVPPPSSPDPTISEFLDTLLGSRLGSSDLSTSDANSYSDHSSKLRANWLLFDSFAREARLLATKHTYRASAMSLADTERLLVHAVDTAYYQVQLAREGLRIAHAAAQFNEEQLADAQRRFEARKITKATVLNFEVRMRAAQANVVAARGLRETNEVILAQLMGLPEAVLPEGVEIAQLKEETEREMAAPAVSDWIDSALSFRPDLARAEHVLNAQSERVIEAKGRFGPELNLWGSWGYERASNVAYSNRDQSAAIGIELSWALFTGGLRSAQLRQARAEWWRARAALRQVRIEIIAQVRRAVADLTNAQESTRLQRLSHEAARENRRLVRSEYAAGKSSLVRLNEAQNDYVQSDAELARARIRLRQVWNDLYAAAGAYSRLPSELPAAASAAPADAEE